MHWKGWYQVAFEHDLTGDLAPASVGETELVLVRSGEGLQAFDAICPHRGANMAYGGRLDGERIVCPFHGYRIGLAKTSADGFCVKAYRTLVVGGLVFVLMSDEHENGLAEFLGVLDETHYFVPGFVMSVQVPPETVIENGFDSTHFKTVHSILNHPRFTMHPSLHGELTVEGTFEIPPTLWHSDQGRGAMLKVPYVASAFSPGLMVSRLGGDKPYWVVTGATPTRNCTCTIRLSLIVPPASDGSAPDPELCRFLLHESRAGLEQDRIIWDNMSRISAPRYTAQDAAVVEFHKFCRHFQEE